MNLKKMYNAVIIGMICMLIVMLILLARFSSLVDSSRDLNQNGIKLVTLSNEMLKTNNYLIKLMRVFATNNNPAILDEYRSLLSYDNLDGKLDKMVEIGLTESEEKQVEELYPLLEILAEIEAQAIEAYSKGDSETAASIIFSDEYIDADFTLENKSAALISDITVRVKAGVAEIQDQLYQMRVLICIFVTLAIMCIIALQIMQRDRVLEPIVEIENILNDISDGNVGVRLVKKHNDEIGALFTHVNSMISSIETYMEESKNAQDVLKNILNGIDAFIYVTVPETGEILFINDKMKQEYGGEGEFVGSTCWSVLQNGFTERCSFCPIPNYLEKGYDSYVWEEHSTATGKYYRNTDTFIPWHDGRRVHMQHSVDLTDSTMLRQELENTVARLEMVVGNYAGIIWQVDADRKFTFFDGALVRKIGFDIKSFVGQRIEDALKNRPDFIEYIEDTFKNGPQRSVSQYYNFMIESNTVTLDDLDGKTVGVVGSSYDVTELIRLQQDLESASKAKSDFLSKMSHEIRTPMNAILGMTELILHENTTNTVLSYASDIKSACRSLLYIINDILDFSKIESGKLEIISVNYHTSSLLIDVVNIIKMRADKKGIPFVVNIDASIPCELMGDDKRINQVLINLLNNAIKFTHEGQITFSVRGKPSGDGYMLEFSIADTGIGIKEDEMDSLFVSFQQFDTRKNRNIEGTGLGLAISKQFTEMMGGVLSVDSEYGVGSVFTVAIPQDIANNEPMCALKNPGKYSILIYENRKAYLKSLTYSFDTMGCPYKLCSNQSDLYEMLIEYEFTHIFVTSLHASKTQMLAAEKQPNAFIVSLNGDGSLPIESGIISISMPIHSLQLANILNYEYGDSQNSAGSGTNAVSMTAPDAKILVVDDNIVNLKVAAGLLKTYDIDADTAISGERAIEMVKETEYDLVFMDHMMPGMDGIDTTVAIRGLEGEYFRKLPIIALTANAISGAKEMFKAEGLNDYLSKPIEMSKLNTILSSWIPQDKQQFNTAKNAENEKINLEIHGVNVQYGLANSGGVLDNYLDILTAYAADGKNRFEELEKSYKEGDYKMLTTNIHALKSASANIGAESLSSIAADLEFACKNGDTEYVDGNIKTFSNELSTILMNINYYLNSIEKEQAAPVKNADSSYLAEAVHRIGKNLENVDIEAIGTELSQLFTYDWDENIVLQLEKMKECLGSFDYDGIESVLTELKRLLLLAE